MSCYNNAIHMPINEAKMEVNIHLKCAQDGTTINEAKMEGKYFSHKSFRKCAQDGTTIIFHISRNYVFYYKNTICISINEAKMEVNIYLKCAQDGTIIIFQEKLCVSLQQYHLHLNKQSQSGANN